MTDTHQPPPVPIYQTPQERSTHQDTKKLEKLPDDFQIVTRFKWKIHHYQDFEHTQKYVLKTSQPVPMTQNPCKKMALFFHRKKFWSTEKIGFMLMETDGTQEVFELKFWLEDKNGKKFGRRDVQRHMFQKIGDRCAFVLGNKLDEILPFVKASFRNSSLTFCCKIIAVQSQIPQQPLTSTEQIIRVPSNTRLTSTDHVISHSAADPSTFHTLSKQVTEL